MKSEVAKTFSDEGVDSCHSLGAYMLLPSTCSVASTGVGATVGGIHVDSRSGMPLAGLGERVPVPGKVVVGEGPGPEAVFGGFRDLVCRPGPHIAYSCTPSGRLNAATSTGAERRERR